MSFVAPLANLAAVLPPHLATAIVLFGIAGTTLCFGLARCGRGFLPRLPAVVFIGAGSVAFCLASVSALGRNAATAIAVAALLIEVALAFKERDATNEGAIGSLQAARRYLVVTLAVVAALLFYHLGTYSGPLLTWEATVVAGYPNVGGFTYAYDRGQSVLEYAAQRFLWDDGLLSAGHTSLLYGAPTYALFHVIGFSAWSLRVAAVIATLLSVVVIYSLAHRFFGPLVGAAAAVAFGLNSCVLFYGRYGSSPAATVLAVLVALWCTWRFLDSERPAWWMGPACAVSLYVATLQYSTARIVVLFLLGFLTAALTWQWRRLHWRQAVGFAVIVAAAAGVWRLQTAFESEHLFLFARGEHYFDLIENPEYINELFEKDLLGRPLARETMTTADKLELLYRVVEATLPEYITLMRPRIETAPLTDVTRIGELPQLYYAPLVLFIVWGFMHSLLRLRAWPHTCLLLWVGAASVPLLLTNRVDSHRIMLFVVPLSLWAAFGLWEAARVLAHARVPGDIRHFLGAILALTVIYNDVHLLHREPRPSNIAAETVLAEAARVPGRLAVGALLNHRDMGWLQLAMLERTRRDRSRAGKMLDERTLREAQNRFGQPESSASRLRPLIEDATVILTPGPRFHNVAAVLQTQGVRVAERGPQSARLLRLDAGAAATGIPDEDLQPLPSITIPPTPTAIPLASGPQVGLTSLRPTDVSFGFAPPQIDHSWLGTRLTIGDFSYAHGIGMHAWCRMTYTVPPGAVAFQAIVGLSEDVRECSAADVIFEVRDQHNRLLFRSPIVTAASPPQLVHVELRDATAITLVATDGKNGRDCDHANWAQPAFLMATQ